jgi:hypothetical protein
MDLEQSNQSAFNLISSSFFTKMNKDTTIIESLWSENTSSQNNIILTLNKNHVIARSNLTQHNDKIFVSEINFDLKFEVMYL